MKRKELEEERGQFVVKANSMIQRNRYSLTLQQHRIILYLISKIKPDDTIDTWYTFDIKSLCEVCGIRVRGGYYYESIKADLRQLDKTDFYIMPNDEEWSIAWLGAVRMNKGDSTVKVRFHPNIEPFLFRLREFYTQYPLESVLAFKSSYSIRLYETLQSYISSRKLSRDIPQQVDLTLDEFRRCLDVQSYPRWADLDRHVLSKGVAEINTYSPDIHVSYTTRKTGRSVSAVVFTVEQPTPLASLTASRNRRQELDGY